MFNVYPDATQGKEVKDLFFVRSGKGTNNLAKEIAVKEVDAENRIVELSFELNTVDVKVGKGLYIDVQYNDADDFNNKEEGSEINGDNPRSIVWNWSTDLANGLSAGNAGSNWGRINFVEAPVVDDGDQGGGGDNTEEDNRPTGDATVALLVVSAAALLGTAIVVGKKRRVQE